MSQSLAGESSNSFDNTDSADNSVFSFSSAHEEAVEILTWLSPLEPKTRHYGIIEHRVVSVGDWLLETEEFQNWLDDSRGGEPSNPALFCYGAPGVGKTHIR